MLKIKQQLNIFSATKRPVVALSATLFAVLTMLGSAMAEAVPGSYGLKVYKVESALYPYVQVYFRTFDESQQPLVNLNELNVGLMVKGKSYDPAKRQYRLNSIRQRKEGTRSVLVLDTSASMAGNSFEAALKAVARYIDSKRPQDEITVLTISDKGNKTGYNIVSEFERDPAALGRRIADIKADSKQSRIYDTIGAGMQMCGMSSQGSVTPALDNHIISCSVVVFSDGKDEGSALSREELNGRISALNLPIPIYSLAYSKNNKDFKNLESISKNSFGIYYPIGESVDRMQPTVEQIQNILQSDYVLTFRSAIPVDGEEHAIKVGVEYPTGSGKYTYESAKMEAVEPPPAPAILSAIAELNNLIPALPEGATPYFDLKAPAAAAAPAPAAAPKQ